MLPLLCRTVGCIVLAMLLGLPLFAPSMGDSDIFAEVLASDPRSSGFGAFLHVDAI
jgi:sorbitol-specific phosphotransferase system component IIBC